jgi:GNAT superfamily N-acetyltransferase
LVGSTSARLFELGLELNYEWSKGEYKISTDRRLLDLDVIYGFLSQSYWAAGRSIETVRHSIDNSLAFGLYSIDKQVGFARVVTDFATFAWLADVFVLEKVRGRGLGVWLLETLVSHPELQNLRRWVLATRDAHELYRKVGFTELDSPERWMIKVLESRSDGRNWQALLRDAQNITHT